MVRTVVSNARTATDVGLRGPLAQRVERTELPTSPPTVGDWVLLAQFSEGLLDKEIHLSNTRINWMVTSQSILFGAFCLILLNRDKHPETARMLLNAIPFMALLIIAGALCGFVAAQVVINRLEYERSYYQAVLRRIFKIEIPDLGCEREGRWLCRTRFFGFFPSAIMSAILLVTWLLILAWRLNISIRIGDF